MNSHVGTDPKSSSSGCCFRQPGTAVRRFKPRQQGRDPCSSFQPGSSLSRTLPPNTAAVSSHAQPSLNLPVLSWNNTYFWSVQNPGVTSPITQEWESWKSFSSICCQSRGAEGTAMPCLTCWAEELTLSQQDFWDFLEKEQQHWGVTMLTGTGKDSWGDSGSPCPALIVYQPDKRD